ncbi:MAG: hypothetical protein HY000_25605 [Planctomycetes bacterium]|nr:hypothetical protein [Planctomycetota bacterium]
MNPDTRAQLKLAVDLAKLAMEEDEPEKAFMSMVQQCLSRDSGWKDFYRENVREVEHPPAASDGRESLAMATALRDSFLSAIGKNPRAAAVQLERALDLTLRDQEDRAPFLQVVANYTHDFDAGKAIEIQRSAYDMDHTLFCPPTAAKRPRVHSGSDLGAVILGWFRQFENPNGAIAAVQDLRARLSYDADPKVVEHALLELAPLLGAEGSRPEEELGEGPDDLWLWSDFSILIEAKNGNQERLHKKDAGQLLLSLQWFKRAYPTRSAPLPLVIAKKANADRLSDFPNGTRVLTPVGMRSLLEKVENFYIRMVQAPHLLAETGSIVSALEGFRLSPKQLSGEYTERLAGVRRS